MWECQTQKTVKQIRFSSGPQLYSHIEGEESKAQGTWVTCWEWKWWADLQGVKLWSVIRTAALFQRLGVFSALGVRQCPFFFGGGGRQVGGRGVGLQPQLLYSHLQFAFFKANLFSFQSSKFRSTSYNNPPPFLFYFIWGNHLCSDHRCLRCRKMKGFGCLRTAEQALPGPACGCRPCSAGS